MEKEKERAVTARTEFDIDTALNTKGFAEFLAAYPDAVEFDAEDETEVAKRFEAFTVKEGVKKEIQDLYSTHIKEEMGISLDADELAAIGEHLEEQAINDPEGLLELRSQLDLYHELPGKIASLEKQLAGSARSEELSADLAALQKDRDDLSVGKRYLGTLGYARLGWDVIRLGARSLPLAMNKLFSKELQDDQIDSVKKEGERLTSGIDGIQAIREKYGKKIDGPSLLSDIEERLGATERALGAVEEAEQLKALTTETFAGVRKALIGGISSIDMLSLGIQEKAMSQLQEIMKTGTMRSLDDTQERLEELQELGSSSETGVDPLGKMDQVDFQSAIDAKLELAASEEIKKAILRSNLGANALMKLEKAIEPLFSREKMGSKEGGAVKAFLADALEEAAGELDDAKENKAKKIVIARILIKLKKK